MTFYQELQLNQAGSKALIRKASGKKEKIRHTGIYLFKILLTLAFCVAFVSVYSAVFGSGNSIVGVLVLLCLMVFRFADFGIQVRGGIGALALIFVVLAAGPRAAHLLGGAGGFLINGVCIFALLFLGCHQIMMANHSTLVLGYLLLYGYDVAGFEYRMRLVGLAAGMVMTMIVYYRNHRKQTYKRNFFSLFREFHPGALRTRWQISMALAAASAVFFAECLGMPRAMWAGIAVMSVTTPFETDMKERVRDRIAGNLAGAAVFAIAFCFLPGDLLPYVGIIGGVGVGLSATYRWQTIFNSFGAMSVAAGLIGLPGAVIFRILHNFLGAVYGKLFFRGWNRFTDLCAAKR